MTITRTCETKSCNDTENPDTPDKYQRRSDAVRFRVCGRQLLSKALYDPLLPYVHSIYLPPYNPVAKTLQSETLNPNIVQRLYSFSERKLQLQNLRPLRKRSGHDLAKPARDLGFRGQSWGWLEFQGAGT